MIDVKKLYFSYTDKPFVENVSFHVGKGEIFGFLGPSGAGKSTIQKVLTGLNTKYKGSVKVAGTEIRERTNRFYENIGVDFEFSTCYEKFTARHRGNDEEVPVLQDGNCNRRDPLPALYVAVAGCGKAVRRLAGRGKTGDCLLGFRTRKRRNRMGSGPAVVVAAGPFYKNLHRWAVWPQDRGCPSKGIHRECIPCRNPALFCAPDML